MLFILLEINFYIYILYYYIVYVDIKIYKYSVGLINK